MSGRFDDYAHVLRLVLIFAVGVAIFLVGRSWLVPDDFGVYGFFRAGALDDNRARPLVYAGRAACADCHVDVVEARRGSRHEAIGCESCHGPLAAHAAGEADAAPERPDPRLTCIRCHDARAGKPRNFPQVDVADHAPDGACSACHEPHRPGIS
jgi:hypothetical protein